MLGLMRRVNRCFTVIDDGVSLGEGPRAPGSGMKGHQRALSQDEPRELHPPIHMFAISCRWPSFGHRLASNGERKAQYVAKFGALGNCGFAP
jgi:hypothetical protein